MKNVYHLHAILVLRGGIGSGHYYAFIRPNLEDKWYEFNDSAVTPVLKSTALSTGCGGFETVFEYKDGRIAEKWKKNDTNAYMLVYIREGEREEIMKEVQIEDIPDYLKERFDEENEVNESIKKEQDSLSDCGTVYLLSPETVVGWSENGICQTTDDVYSDDKFHDNDE